MSRREIKTSDAILEPQYYMEEVRSNHVDGEMAICRRSVAMRRKDSTWIVMRSGTLTKGPTGEALETKRGARLGPTVPPSPQPRSRDPARNILADGGTKPIAQGSIRRDGDGGAEIFLQPG